MSHVGCKSWSALTFIYLDCNIVFGAAPTSSQPNGYDCAIFQWNILEGLYVQNGIDTMATGGSDVWDRPRAREFFEQRRKVICIGLFVE